MSGTAKSSVAVKDERVTRVFGWLSEGRQRREIIQLASDWDVTDRTIDNYIAAADEHRGLEAAKRRTRMFGESLRRYRDYERHAFDVAQEERGRPEGSAYLGRAIAARRALCEVVGLNAPVQVEDVTERLAPGSGFAGLPKHRLLELRKEFLRQLNAVAIENGGDGRGH